MSIISRRFFIHTAVGGAGVGAALSQSTAAMTSEAALPTADTEMGAAFPVFCAHEHWGSFAALGAAQDGFRADMEAGAEPVRATSLWDLVLDPYFGGWLAAAGFDGNGQAQAAGHSSHEAWRTEAPREALQQLAPFLRQQMHTGAFQCLRQGIHALHGADIAQLLPESWQAAETSIQAAYQDIFGWHEAAATKLNISGAIRPVHPEFFMNEHPAAVRERGLMRPILRIDPMLDWWPQACPRRDRMAEALGVDAPGDALSWRAFLTALFDYAAARGNVGIKQLQAYRRDLNFQVIADESVRFRGDLTEEEQRLFQDWLMHECCKEAHARRWPHQIHVGTHNLPHSSPLPLAELARRYPGMNLVLLHCWPFIEESGHLAKHHGNVYLDSCWQTILNPAFFKQSLDMWLGYLPINKLMCSQDATSVEMAAGSVLITRARLHGALTQLDALNGVPEDCLRHYMQQALDGTARNLYGA